MVCRFLVSTLFLLASLQILAAEPSVQRHFGQYQGFQFVLSKEVDRPRESLSGFSAQQLRETLARNYSLWEVRSAAGSTWNVEIIQAPDTLGAFFLFNRFSVDHSDFQSFDLEADHLFSPNLAAFWRGPYFFRIRPGQGALTRENFQEFVSQTIAAVSVKSLPPLTIVYLPETDLVSDSVRFYLGSDSLAENPAFPNRLLDEIGFEDRIEVSYGEYGPAGDDLFIIAYPTPDSAAKYFVRLQDELTDFFTAEGLYMKRTGPLVVLYRGQEERAVSRLDGIRYHARIDWIYEKDKSEERRAEVVTFFGLVTTAILGTGAMIVLALIGGLVVGLIRYEALRRFPILTTRNEMIRLNLDS